MASVTMTASDYRQASNAALLVELEKRGYGSWGENAYIKGWVAAEHGYAMFKCPYPDYRTELGRVTFARAYRKKWLLGFVAFVNWRTTDAVTKQFGSYFAENVLIIT